MNPIIQAAAQLLSRFTPEERAEGLETLRKFLSAAQERRVQAEQPDVMIGAALMAVDIIQRGGSSEELMALSAKFMAAGIELQEKT